MRRSSSRRGRAAPVVCVTLFLFVAALIAYRVFSIVLIEGRGGDVAVAAIQPGQDGGGAGQPASASSTEHEEGVVDPVESTTARVESDAIARPELAIGRTTEYDYDPPEPGSYTLPVIKPAGDGPVLRLDGKRGQLREMIDGRITVLSFIYTRCADPTACPYAMSTLHKIRTISEQDAEIAENLRLVTFSFDPDHDTPRTLADYTKALRRGDGAEWQFVTTESGKELSPILERYGQQVDRRKDPNHPLGPFSHLLRVYLIDRDGMIRNIYSSGMLDPRLVLTDVRTLLLEEQTRSKEATPDGGT